MNDNCLMCGKKLTKDEIGIYKKLVDENADTFECLECLSCDIGVTKEALEEKIADFKNEGCKLFL